MLPQRCDHRRKLQRAGFLGRLRPCLNSAIAEQGVTLWLKTRRSEPLHDRCRFSLSARICYIEEERPFGRGAGNEAKLLGRYGVTSYQLNRVAAVACRTCQQPDLRVVSTNECH